MAVFQKLRLEVDPYGYDEFYEAFTNLLVPMSEESGRFLVASFVETMNSIKPVVIHDLWEIKDLATAAGRWLEQPYMDDPRWIEYSERVRNIILKEEVVYMIKRCGRLDSIYGSDDETKHRPGLFVEGKR